MASLVTLSRTWSLIHLLLLYASLLQLHVCTAILEITQPPTSKVTILGENATFHCSASGGSFQWVINIASRGSPLFIIQTSSVPEIGLTAQINHQFNMASSEYDYTATVTLQGSMASNNTELYCSVSSFTSQSNSIPANLTVIGPPNTPSGLTIQQHLYMEPRQFSASWSVPFSHANHSISHYILRVANTRTGDSYESSIGSSSEDLHNDVMNITLPFPNQTDSCDILIVTAAAVNDVGSSEPTSTNLSIPEVPDSAVSVLANVLFEPDGSPVILLEIKFPKLCPFERLNYSILLAQLGEENELVMPELKRSVLDPPGSVTETITAGVEANANYSLVVLAATDVWNSSSPLYNLSTHLTPTAISTATDDLSSVTPTAAAASPETDSRSSLVLGITVGTSAVLLLLIIVVITLICVLRSHRRKSGLPTSDEEVKIDNMPCNLTPNPIYDGPVYDTIQEPFQKLSSLKSQPLFQAGNPEPIYSESPSHNKQKHRKSHPGSEYEELTHYKREMEDCYVHMQSYKRQ